MFVVFSKIYFQCFIDVKVNMLGLISKRIGIGRNKYSYKFLGDRKKG